MSRILSEGIVVQFAILVVAVALFASTYGQSFTATDLAQSPMFFPRIILGLWIVLGLIALGQAIRAQDRTAPISSWGRIAIVVIAAVIYTNMIGSEGFFLPSVVFSAICLPAFGMRNPFVVAGFAVLLPGALVLVFNHALGMPLPTSRFTYLF